MCFFCPGTTQDKLHYLPSTALDDVLLLPLTLPLLTVRFLMPWFLFVNFAFDLEGAGDMEGLPIRLATSSEIMKRLLCRGQEREATRGEG